MHAQDSKRLSQQRFGRYAQGYVTSRNHAKGAELDVLVEIANPAADWTVLDVATGGGHTALKFAPFVARVIATDLTPAMLDAAAAFVTAQGVRNVTFQQADAESLPFADACFDLVTCRVACHHFPAVQRFVEESARVLKPGGMLLVQDHVLPDDVRTARYIDDFERLRDPSHHCAYSESDWRAMFAGAGLAVEHAGQLLRVHSFREWTAMQHCAPAVTKRLVEMVVAAPEAVLRWMQPVSFGTADAMFVNHHIVIAGRKPAGAAAQV